MDYGFSTLMFIFSGAILFYAALLAITKDYNLLPYRSRVSVKPKNSKEYTFQLAKVVALTAVAPAIGGSVGLINQMIGLIVMLAGFVIAIWAGTKIMKKVL